MVYHKNDYSLKKFNLMLVVAILIIFMAGCTPNKECTDIRLKIEEDYLNGWRYIKDIDSLDGEKDITGRILFALYENGENAGEYAVLKVTKLTVPDSYNGYFVRTSYDSSRNIAESLDDSNQMHFKIIYDSSGIKISNE